MIRDKRELSTISSKAFTIIVSRFNKEINKYISSTLPEYCAFYIAKGYEMDAIWSERLDLIVYEAMEMLSQTDRSMCNIEDVKRILCSKYGLNVVNDEALKIEKIKHVD